ncbi:AI-2E family transporter [Paenibacillus sp. NEAU-GSW1]|uniref:AI-2E family transporter n=1 Tax=Paenibacillus sp. NEAU-GSW1 TaxID=2682486 RepID=UPI0012E1DF1F|nr:AI-2E family transporter [Paenibacillus sp. NEAU-GSW1]MUT68407.1 AI-2E family transporter [Paenibacillus sp. NEAU-GSW1]
MEDLHTGKSTNRFKQFFLNNKFVVFLLVLLLIGLNIFVFTKISFIFTPLTVLLKTILLPVLLAGVVYYLLNPIVDYMEKWKIKRVYSILLLFLIIIGLIAILLGAVIPLITDQITSLIDNFPYYAKQAQNQIDSLMGSDLTGQIQQYFNFDPNDLVNNATQKVTEVLNNAWSSIGSFISTLKEILLAIITLPFILFYLLYEGKKLPRTIVGFLPNKLRMPSLRVFSEMNLQISSYIRGQIIVSFCIGLLLYIGYIIIGLKYSLVLALIAACTAVIPYLGPAIAITPALVVALVTSPIMLVKMIVIWTIVQLIEGKFISPQIMGKTLKIHPITIIFVILTAGNLFGVAGVILAVPGYAVLKVIFMNLFNYMKAKSTLYEDEPIEKIEP